MAGSPEPSRRQRHGLVLGLLHGLASLRLTVLLLALSIVLIFAGTLAQVNKDIWEVMGLYFRTWFAWVPLQVFFPRSFFPSEAMQSIPGGFYFPGGFLIGSAMAINLLAAHGLRFTVQARGARLTAGLATIALGVLLTVAVVLGGSDKELVAGSEGLKTSWLWGGVEAAVGMLWLSILYAIWEIPRERVWERRLLTAAAAVFGVVLGVLLYEGPAIMPDPSAMRILWQLVKATSAALMLLAGCILIFRKRAGIVLLHAGVGLMMANELVVYSLHAEGMMSLTEGDRTNYAQDVRNTELAITSPADSATGSSAADKSEGTLEDVTVIPRGMLEKNETIRSPLLPFDVELVKYLANSKLRKVESGENNLATAGAGLHWAAAEARPSAGTDMDQKVDSAAAYITLIDKEKKSPIGTYLVGQELLPQAVEVGGKKYEITLRFPRYYKPYTVELLDVRSLKYQGTPTPRDYSSEVRIAEPAHGVDRQVRIWMNNPLRFAGDTLYQSGYKQMPSGEEVTTLQVVKNVGWMIPYIGCMIVAVGMLAHFSLTLVRFLRRRDAEELAAEEHIGLAAAAREVAKPKRAKQRHQPASTSRWGGIALPAIVVAGLAFLLAHEAETPQPKPGKFDFYQFGELPLVYEGRVKPFDTLARNSLLFLSGKQAAMDEVGRRHWATEWLLDSICQLPARVNYRVFLIQNPDVLEFFQLKPRVGFKYSLGEMRDHLDAFRAEVKKLHKFQEDEREAGRNGNEALTLYQKKLLELDRRLDHYLMLAGSLSAPPVREDHLLEDLRETMDQGAMAVKESTVPLVVPPQSGDGDWELFPMAWVRAYASRVMKEQPNPATLALETIFVEYGKGDVEGFNRAVKDYGDLLAAHPPADADLAKVDYEAWFDHFEPFYWSLYLDLTAFVLVVLGWIGKARLMNRTAFWVLVLTFAVHTLGLVSRIYISGRPPVTNLYSAAVFIGWGGMLFGLILEVIYRLGIGNLIASVAGFATLLIAHFLASGDDTMKVLQAVLDTQFWLATHVVCVTLGYMATFVTGLLGIFYIFHAAFRRDNTELRKTISRMLYGTLCFAIFFSFVGTVLGGLWADDSWGRFWGWDPKENGALMIVAWNALLLHARWGKMVGDRGLAMLSVWGNAVTAWSFFGVNELGMGLHSYGFTEGVAAALGLFVLAQLAIIAFAAFDGWRTRRSGPMPSAA